ncbi:MAG: sigma 54-interacting transcriptional regulator, partial [Gammaproteobacteria bacterium]|nr:sigma 54-interacting transcriptional regulator [Gammaproteobacteria bacterium]
PHELLESELFGHEPGAFTGAKGRRRGLMEQASGGTLFLDEIAELDPELQAKLLRAVEDQRIRRLGGDREISVDLQILAATNRDLEAKVAEGAFRNDLFHRLSVFRLELPPLRSRKADLEDLVPLFVAEFNAKAGRRVRSFPDALWERLRAHDWPGNVRELRNVVERCVLFSDGEEFPLEWLQLGGPAGAGSAQPTVCGSEGVFMPLDGSMAIEDMDRHIIRTALEKHDFNVSATARALGTTRETLRYRVQKYRLLPDPD